MVSSDLPSPLIESWLKVTLPGIQSKRRHDKVILERRDNFPESRTDYHADGEVHGIASGHEGFDFIERRLKK
jgi:hypothetical protein